MSLELTVRVLFTSGLDAAPIAQSSSSTCDLLLMKDNAYRTRPYVRGHWTMNGVENSARAGALRSLKNKISRSSISSMRQTNYSRIPFSCLKQFVRQIHFAHRFKGRSIA